MDTKHGCFKDVFLGSVTVGERGQVVIPADAREKLGIEPGEKLLAFMHPMGWGVSFVKVEAIFEFQKTFDQLASAINESEGGDENADT